MSYEAAQTSLFPAARNALDARGGLAFDGTASSRVHATLTNQNIGTDSFSIALTFRVPSSNPSVDFGLANLSSSATTSVVGNSFESYITSAGALTLGIRNAASTDQKILIYSGFITAYGGKIVTLVFTRSGTTGATYVNGVALTSGSLAGGGSLADSVTSTYMGLGYRETSTIATTPFYSASLYNLALTQTDVTEIYELGGAVPERFKFGTQVPAYSSDFSATHDWTDAVGGSTLTANVDSINGQNDWLSVQRGTTGPITIYRSASMQGPAFNGKVIRARARVWVPVGSTATHVGWYFNNTNGSANPATPVAAGNQYDLDATWMLPLNIAAVPRHGIRTTNLANSSDVSVGAGEILYFKNIIWNQVGAVVHFDADLDGIGYQLHDQSTNQLDALLTATGVAWTIPANRGYLRGTLTWAGTHETKQLGASPAIPDGAVVEMITVKATAGGTMGISSNSSFNRWVNAQAFTTAKKSMPLANQLQASSAVTDRDFSVDPDSVNYTGSIQVTVSYCSTQGA